MPEAYKETSLLSNQNTQKKTQQGQENEKKTICYVFPAQRQQETEKHTKTILSLSLCFVFSLLFCFPWPTA